jgi:hypothetical protein
MMSASTIYELIGYVGSALIVVSLTRTSLLKFRLWGLVGSMTFLVYSLLIEAYPIAIVNVVIITIHLWFIRELTSRSTEFFTILHVRRDSRYLLYFLDFYRSEIGRFQPEFAYEPAEVQITVFILRNAVPAGLFIGEVCEDDSIEVKLDFATPAYRDLKAGQFLYSTRSGVFENWMCDTAWTISGTKEHINYLESMGFEATIRHGSRVYAKDISELHEPPPPDGTVPFVVSDT